MLSLVRVDAKMERKVWSEFQCTKQQASLQLTVLDCPADRFDDVIDLYRKYFIREAPVKKLAGISKRKEALKEYTIIFEKQLKEEGVHIAICIEKNTDALIGVSSMQLLNSTNTSPNFTPQTKEVAKLFEMIEGRKKMYDIPNSYSVDTYYNDIGIIVHPDYRGYGIGSALVESRKNICKTHGVSITGAWMTSIGTQRAAERDGWETPFEIDSHEFARKFDVKPYDGIAPFFKFMIKKIL